MAYETHFISMYFSPASLQTYSISSTKSHILYVEVRITQINLQLLRVPVMTYKRERERERERKEGACVGEIEVR